MLSKNGAQAADSEALSYKDHVDVEDSLTALQKRHDAKGALVSEWMGK
jgi:hypothetical protein